MVRLVIVFALFAACIASCALWAEGPPENTCRGDADCFQAQGERCNLETKRCEPGDASVPDAALDAAVDAP